MPDLAQGELGKSDADIILECKARFTFSQQAESGNRSEFEFDKRFVDGDQWDPTIRDERFSDRRPCLTVNITDAICRRVVNSCRENRPRIVTHPVGNGADIPTSKVFNGLIRHIEYASNAEWTYDSAVENSIQGGWGWMGVDGDFVSDQSFDQELKIVGWSNPLMCYGDPNSRMPDGSDMDWFIETKFMKRTDYKQKFGALDGQGWQWVGRGDSVPDWSNKEEIRVAKYWRVERIADTLYKLSDGKTMLKSEALKKKTLEALKLTIVDERSVDRKQVVCYLLTALKILKTTEWPGKWIPRVPVYGRRSDLNGQMKLKGLVRDIRDPARIYNYAVTSKTEAYAMAPKAQWVGAEGFMDGHEAAWRDSNRKPIVSLEYKPQRMEDGTYAPPPTRMAPPQPNAGFAEWGDSTKSDFLAVAGMSHDPGQDAKGEVVSGIAIKRREGLADVSNFDFYDNLTRSMCHLGRIIVDLIPHYYDTPRMIRIIQEDGTPETLMLNEKDLDPVSKAVIKIKNDMTVGDYEVVVDTGPNYKTKREQTAEAELELLATPLGEMVAKAAGDKVIRAMDFPGADEIADRLQAIIPGAMTDAHSDLPPKAQTLIAGLNAQLKQANQKNLALELEIHTKKGLEQMRQQGETDRLHIREGAETQRTQMELGVKREDAHLKADTSRFDTHVKSITARDTTEIGAAAQLLNTHAEAAHARQAAKDLLASATSAEKSAQ